MGLSTGLALLTAGVAEVAISRSDFETAGLRSLCAAGFCAAQFSLERVFEISQKAALGDPRGELEDFRRALRLSPASAYRWADLAEAELNDRDEKQAEYAISQALQAGPKSAVIRMRAANLYFQIGDNPLVIQQLKAVLSDPGLNEYYDTAFLTYSRLGIPVNEILSSGLPRRPDVLSSLLVFWTKSHKADEAIATWKWASERNLVNEASSGLFFRFLIEAGRQNEAQQLWQQCVTKQQPGYRKADWIFNPGFEHTPKPSPFDWTIQQRQDVEALRVQDVKYEGGWAYCIRFNGETNTAYHQTFQDMVLAPGKYQFSVMVKADQVTTDEGVRLHIYDWPTQGKLNVWTDTLTGTQDWTRIAKSFELPDGVKVVRVEVARMSSGMLDNKIGGTTWIDAFLLQRQ